MVLDKIKSCKVTMDSKIVYDYCHLYDGEKTLSNSNHVSVCDLFFADLTNKNYTDLKLVSSDGNTVSVHKVMLAAQSPLMEDLLQHDDCDCISFPDVDFQVLKLLVLAMYTGEVKVDNSMRSAFMSGLNHFHKFGLLRQLYIRSSFLDVKNKTLNLDSNGNMASKQQNVDQSYDSDVEESLVIDMDKPTEESKAIPKRTDVNNDLRTTTKRKGKSDSHSNDETNGSAIPKKKCSKIESLQSDSPGLSKRRSRIRLGTTRPNLDAITEVALNDVLSKGNRALIEFLLQNGFLSQPAPCYACGLDCELLDDPESQGQVSWSCPNNLGKRHSKGLDPRIKSVFEKCSESLGWIMKIVLCWKDNISLTDCQEKTGAKVDDIFRWYDLCTEHFKI